MTGRFWVKFRKVNLWAGIIMFYLTYHLDAQFLSISDEENHEYVEGFYAHPTHWLIPDNFSIQLLRDPGFISIGAGYNVWKVYEPSLFFGYMFQNYGKGQPSPTLSLKHNFRLLGGSLQRAYNIRAGLSVNVVMSEKTYKKMPVYDKRRNYFSNELYLTPFFGGDVRIINGNALFRTGNLFFELVTLDAYLKDLMNSRFVALEDIWSFNLGIIVYLQ